MRHPALQPILDTGSPDASAARGRRGSRCCCRSCSRRRPPPHSAAAASRLIHGPISIGPRVGRDFENHAWSLGGQVSVPVGEQPRAPAQRRPVLPQGRRHRLAAQRRRRHPHRQGGGAVRAAAASPSPIRRAARPRPAITCSSGCTPPRPERRSQAVRRVSLDLRQRHQPVPPRARLQLPARRASGATYHRRVPVRTSTSSAVWEGGLRDGRGHFSPAPAPSSGDYSFATRFEGAKGTNPEELIAAAHAACLSMALSAGLEAAKTPATRISTKAACTIEKVGDGFRSPRCGSRCAAKCRASTTRGSGGGGEGEGRLPRLAGAQGQRPDGAGREAGIDPVCHTLVGAALARSGLGQRTALGTATLLIGANLPDIDVLAYLDGPAADLVVPARLDPRHSRAGRAAVSPDRRGAAASTGLVRRMGRAVLPSGVLPRRGAAARASSPSSRHPLLDTLNTYGVRWLMPFRGDWYYGDALFIVDPWLWLVLGVGVVASNGRRSARAATTAARPAPRESRWRSERRTWRRWRSRAIAARRIARRELDGARRRAGRAAHGGPAAAHAVRATGRRGARRALPGRAPSAGSRRRTSRASRTLPATRARTIRCSAAARATPLGRRFLGLGPLSHGADGARRQAAASWSI